MYFDASNLWSNILCPKAYCLPCYYVWLMPVATVISGLFFDLTALGTVGGDVSWHNQYEEQLGDSSRLKRELPYDLAILYLDIYPRGEKSLKNIFYPYV